MIKHLPTTSYIHELYIITTLLYLFIHVHGMCTITYKMVVKITTIASTCNQCYEHFAYNGIHLLKQQTYFNCLNQCGKYSYNKPQ